MGSVESSTIQSQGSVNGRPVVFHYTKADDPAESKFSWTEGHQVSPAAQWTHIAANDIIGVAPPSNDSRGDVFYLMYVEDVPAGGSTSAPASPKIFRHLDIISPPTAFVHDFHVAPPDATCTELRYDRGEGQLNSHIVVSRGSGTGTALAVWEQLVKPMLDLIQMFEGSHYALHVTTTETSISEFVRETILPRANLGIAQAIMMLSGDGGPLDVLNTLLASPRDQQRYKKPNVALMPIGTGNALAHSTGITVDNTMGLRNWANGRLKELPYFHATFSPGARALFNEARDERVLDAGDPSTPTAYGAVVCSWAFHAALVADSDTAEYRKFGAERFKMAAKENLVPSDGSPAHVYKGKLKTMIRRESGDYWTEIPREEHMYVLGTLVSTLEAGFTISPASRPLNGKLRLVHFGPMSPDEAMGAMGGAYQGGKHVEDPKIGYQQIDGLRIEFQEADPRWRRVCIDGKIIRVEDGGFVEVKLASEGVLDLIVMKRSR